MKDKKNFPIVGIGASAGGLDPMKEFFGAVPPDCGMAFVVVTHRAPASTTVLPEILSRVTKLTVLEPADQTTVEPGHVYISPPGHYIGLHDNVLKFQNVITHDGISLPIDFFFRSLAEEKKDRAICVILSGNGSDGTLGMTAIKGEGGMAMVQDENSAQFKSMPAQATATGLVDYALPPGSMPEEIIKYSKSLRMPLPAKPTLVKGEGLNEILEMVRKHNGSDFGQYKTNTLVRRIERRMNVHHITDPRQYVRYIKGNAHEASLLFKELLIGVTGFFRDAPAFEALEKEILPELLKNKQDGDAVRVWSVGCSTGEEAYSLAILLREYAQREKMKLNIQIFASDIDSQAVKKARAGLYADGIALDLSSDRLKENFTHEDDGFRVVKPVREMLTFAVQNLIHDPPFTKLDMISCRNLLIYLDGELQKRIIPLFHYSLKPCGVLFLGSSETVGAFTDLFAPADARWKIFRRRDMPLAGQPMPKWNTALKTNVTQPMETTARMPKETANITELAQKILLAHHIPPSLIVNEKGDIFFIHGRTGQFLEPQAGQTRERQNALEMAREGLQMPLASVIRKAATSDDEARQDDVRVRTNGHFTTVSLRGQKIRDPEALRGLIWISFDETSDNHAHREPLAGQPEAQSKPEEGELQFVRDNLRHTIEELEVANEELKSANEELQSTNEELQSSNEELETAKEEMQSLNEELRTVNAELEAKVGELAHANDDMKNLLNSTGIATIFLDDQLNVKRFTNNARKIFHLIHSDIGRPLSDIVSDLEYTDLVRDATEVLQTLVYKEFEVRSRDWSWYLMRILPYRTTKNVIEGLCITFVEISRLKKTEILLAANTEAFRLMLLGEAPIGKVLDDILLTIERQAAGIWCVISLIGGDRKHLVRGFAPSMPQEFTDALHEAVIAPDAAIPAAEAAATGKNVFVSDISSREPHSSFAVLAEKHNVKAAWAQPVFLTDGELAGVFTVYYRRIHTPSDVEKELVTQTMPLVATALWRQDLKK